MQRSSQWSGAQRKKTPPGRVGGAPGASTGYRATLPRATAASAVCFKLEGSPNASYYVNVYNEGGRNILVV